MLKAAGVDGICEKESIIYLFSFSLEFIALELKAHVPEAFIHMEDVHP